MEEELLASINTNDTLKINAKFLSIQYFIL